VTYDQGWHELIDYRWEPSRIRKFMQNIPGTKLQAGYKQRTFKVSYDVNHEFCGVNLLRQRLRKAGIHVNIVFSHDMYLDFLPLRASKGSAVRYFSDKWNIPLENVLVAGDSGNDIDMMLGRTMGVVVGNHEEALHQLKKYERVYFAEGHYAKGILEAARHFKFFNDSENT
jgi:sucrose-phosphate synthase